MKVRTGDRVRVKEPFVIVRVGYPLGIDDGLRAVRGLFSEQIKVLLGSPTTVSDLFTPSQSDLDARESIERALALRWLRQQGFGGPARTLHTRCDESLRGQEAQVIEMKTRFTGTRVPGRVSGWESPEYDPPYLSDVKAHRIATLDVITTDEIHVQSFADIDVSNLEAVV